MRHFMMSVCITLVAVGPAAALVETHDHEQHGNKPFPASTGTWKHVAAVLNAPGREYWRDRGTTGFGHTRHEITIAYRGEAARLNQLIKVLNEIPTQTKPEVALLPGAGLVVDKKQQRIDCDWRVRLIYVQAYDLTTLPPGVPQESLTIHVEVLIPDVPSPAAPVSAEKVAAWINDLDGKQFAMRERAQRELTRQGPAVRGTIQQALDGKPSAEKKRRLEQILQHLSQLQLSDIDRPRGLSLLSFEMLVERECKSLTAKNSGDRWQACLRLHDAVEGSDERLNLLAALLDDEELAVLKDSTANAPKDYLLSFKPLLNAKPLPAETRAAHAAMYQELRKRLDKWCK